MRRVLGGLLGAIATVAVALGLVLVGVVVACDAGREALARRS